MGLSGSLAHTPGSAERAKDGGAVHTPGPHWCVVPTSSGWEHRCQPAALRRVPHARRSNPLRGPRADGEYLRQFLSTIAGPVVLVGHSYGGAVISNAATGNADVKSLIYMAAYALDEGERVSAANALGGGSHRRDQPPRAPPDPGRDRRRRRRLHRSGLLPPALRPRPAPIDHTGYGHHPTTRKPWPPWSPPPDRQRGSPFRAGTSWRAGPRPSRPGPTSDGHTYPRQEREHQQLTRRDDDPAVVVSLIKSAARCPRAALFGRGATVLFRPSGQPTTTARTQRRRQPQQTLGYAQRNPLDER